jgi:FlaA1/EpsC-like NDP-sugar epimerase
MLDEKNHIVSTGPDMSRFFFSVSDAVTLVCAAFDNIDVVSGKILSLPMKGTELRRILDIWVESKNATWTLGERRPGDRDLEYLLSKNEAEVTQKIELSSKPYFLMDPTQKTPIQGGLTEEFSSLSAEQFTDSELQDLILTPPAVRFL